MTRVRQSRRPQAIVRTVCSDGMYIVALMSSLLTLPQMLQVWTQRQAFGVSLLTWSAYTVLAAIWLIYGLVRKERPIILSEACLLLVDFGVVLGVLIFRR